MRIHYFIISLLLANMLGACEQKKDPALLKEYKGPLATFENIRTLFSDSAVVRIVLEAPVQLDFKNGNRVFPKGIHIHFFEKDGSKYAELTANSATFDATKKLYTAKGNVIVSNALKKEKLNTEKLFWNPDEKRVFTDNFVKIETEEEILQGQGLEAAQDFSTYKILKPTGVFSLDNEEE